MQNYDNILKITIGKTGFKNKNVNKCENKTK